MKKVLLLAFITAPFAPVIDAQTLVNPSFETGDFTGYTTVGIPSISGAPPTVPNGNFQALINSTGTTGAGVYAIGNAASAAQLDATLGVTLPANSFGAVINGEAIQQTFTTTKAERLTFSYKYASRELGSNGADETGYILNGQFHILADSTTPGQTMAEGVGFLDSGLPYRTLSLNLPAGTNTIAFVAYNTGNTNSPSGIYVDNLVLTPAFLTAPGLTPNQRAIANYVVAHAGDPGLAPLLNVINAAPSVQVLAQELNALSPESLGIFRQIAFDNSTFMAEGVNDHLANLRDGLTGFDSSGLSVTDPSLTPDASRMKMRLADPKTMLRDPKDMNDSKEMATGAAPAPVNRWSLWIAGNVVLADLEHDGDVEHESYTTGSVMLGTDYRIDEHFTVGVLVGFGHTDASLDHEGSKATLDTYYPALYASYVDNGWYANGLAAYNYNSYTEARHFALPGLNGFDRGAPQGNEYLGDLDGGYEFHHGAFKYGPFAGVQFTHLDINSFDEDGPAALDVQTQNDDSLRSQLGFEFRYSTRLGDVALVPHASTAWQHEFLDEDRGITSSFSGSGPGSFTVQAQDPGHDSALIDVGLDADLSRDVTLFADYETEAGEDSFFAQSVLAGVRFGF